MADIVVSGNSSGSVTLRAPDVSGTTILTLPTTTGTLVVTGGAQTVQFAAGSAAAPSITFTGDTNTGIYSPAADTIAFTEGGVESMRIDASGSVGIGAVPSAWSLFKPVEFSGGNYITGVGSQVQVGSNNFYNGAAYIYKNTDLAARYYQNTGAHIWDTAVSGTAGNAITFLERMRIDSSGNVGIGTSSPTSTASYGGVSINGSSGSALSLFAANATVFQLYTDNSTYGLKFYDTRNSAERMRIDSSGNLLVGATSQLNGTGMTVSTGGRGVSCTIAIQGSNNTGSNARVYLEVPGVNAGGFTYERSTSRLHAWSQNELSGPYVTAAGTSWTTNSDVRLKTNIDDISYGLSTVMALQPKKYVYKNNIDKECLGFIAQDVVGVIPEIVDTPEDKDGMLGIEYQALVPVLVKAIQELNAKVTALEAQLGAK